MPYHTYLSIITQWLLHLLSALTQENPNFAHIVYVGVSCNSANEKRLFL